VRNAAPILRIAIKVACGRARIHSLQKNPILGGSQRFQRCDSCPRLNKGVNPRSYEREHLVFIVKHLCRADPSGGLQQ
jgi:hypothetical protein